MHNLGQLKSPNPSVSKTLHKNSFYRSQTPPAKATDDSAFKQLPASSSSFRIDDILLKSSSTHTGDHSSTYGNSNVHHQLSNIYNYFSPMLMSGKLTGFNPEILSLVYNGLNSDNSSNFIHGNDPRFGFKHMRRPDSFSQTEINK